MNRKEMKQKCLQATSLLNGLLIGKGKAVPLDLNDGVDIEINQTCSLDYDEMKSIMSIKEQLGFDGMYIAADFMSEGKDKRLIIQLTFTY